MKIKHSAFLISTILSTLFLIGRSDASEKQSTNSNSEYATNIGQEILCPMTETEQYEKSDLVYIITAGDKGKVTSINEQIYTFYSLEINEALKGDERINTILLRGNTTPESNVASSIDESLTNGLKYKVY